MDIRELRTFIAVAQTGNITRAAEELHISQPALSRQIIKLENELGCKLLERGGHGISLSNAGHLLLNRARKLSDLLDKTETELKTPDVASGEVSIACSETRAGKRPCLHTARPLAHIACRAHLEPQPPTLARRAGVFRRRRSLSGQRAQSGYRGIRERQGPGRNAWHPGPKYN